MEGHDMFDLARLVLVDNKPQAACFLGKTLKESLTSSLNFRIRLLLS